MDQLVQVLKGKIEQLPADKQAKATYLFAEQVRKFLTDKRSIDTLDLLKLYHAGEDVSSKELMAATYAANAANAAAWAAATYAAAAAWARAANAAYAAYAAAYDYADAAAYAANAARQADPSITIESQIAIVDRIIKGE
jgi:hypothetical protein